ncbi:protein HESO1 [Dendrobium catenatum]|uniref:DNA polymerase sigma subunit n=1 Tax=Dendrobium catenatum TaxID=906689 RepID=A0A2I0W8E4_9ASPA|nr:protein HESO1 [Dendrobium catenatum]PKU71921.1 DNA polymerase sigma subunit [Dendrobium catenatum]
MMAYSEPLDIYVHSELELCVKEILSFIKPTVDDIQKRESVINELAGAIQIDQSLRGASVKAFGSYISNLYSRWGDLDISIDMTQSSTSSADRWCKLNALEKIMWALQRTGIANNIEFVRHARVPLVVYQSRRYNISCDITIDNRAGYVKSYILRLISNIDERFRELVLLIKECAKAQHLNDPKTGTLNSYSLCLLIIFHFQTCRPAIFPPLRDLYKGNIVDDVKGHSTLRHVEDSFVAKIATFRSEISGQRNQSSICQLLISFFDKFSALGTMASNHAISTYRGEWKPIYSNRRFLRKAQVLRIEDPFEQTENAARAVDTEGLAMISQTFSDMHRKLSSRSAPLDRTLLLDNLVRPEIKSDLEHRREPMNPR